MQDNKARFTLKQLADGTVQVRYTHNVHESAHSLLMELFGVSYLQAPSEHTAEDITLSIQANEEDVQLAHLAMRRYYCYSVIGTVNNGNNINSN